MALTFATRYRALPILIGITIATARVHLVSVFVGAVFGAALPTRAITVRRRPGLPRLRGVDAAGRPARRRRGVKARTADALGGRRRVGVAFFLAELGDKTMLATITLATTEGLFGAWVGSTRRHGGGRRAGDRGRTAAGHAAAGAGDQDRRRRDLRPLRRRAPGGGDTGLSRTGPPGEGLDSPRPAADALSSRRRSPGHVGGY